MPLELPGLRVALLGPSGVLAARSSTLLVAELLAGPFASPLLLVVELLARLLLTVRLLSLGLLLVLLALFAVASPRGLLPRPPVLLVG